jgi:hypothetical protein
MPQGDFRTKFEVIYTNAFSGLPWLWWRCLHIQNKPIEKTKFPWSTIQESIFPVSDTEFEGGDGRGCGDFIFLVFGQNAAIVYHTGTVLLL